MKRDDIILINDFIIMCDDCGWKYRLPSDFLDVVYACSEHPMRIEVKHKFYSEMDCQWRNMLSYTVTAVEYPARCTYIDEPSAEMDYYISELALSIYEEIQ